MSRSSNNKNNTNQQSVAEQEKEDNKNNIEKDDINKIVDFMPKWKKEQTLFDKAIIRHLYSESGRRLKETRTWPRIKTTEEILYEQFMAKVSNPVDGQFYSQRDSDGNVIDQKDEGPNCRYIVEYIIRFKTVLGEEFLYSGGHLKGYDASGMEVRRSISKPEAWTRTLFDTERIYDNELKTFYETTKGPLSSFEEYTLLFSQENVQMLYDKRDKSRQAKPISFYVKDEQSSMDVSVRWSSVQDTLKLFKEKEFDFLFNGNYIPTAIKEEMRIRTDALTGEQNIGPATNPATNFNYNNNNNSDSHKDINAYT